MSTETDTPSVCIGCGRDHPPGKGCGYAREVVWTPYTGRERWGHIKFVPPLVGFAAAAAAVYLVQHPPEAAFLFWVGIMVLGIMALFLGGFGSLDFVREVRKKRWRAASKDGRDRGLVVLLGGKVKYGFGEALRYNPVEDLEWAAPLRSDRASGNLAALRAALNPGFRSLLRAAVANEDVFRDDRDDDAILGPMELREESALVLAATVLGLAGRGEIQLSEGRYRPWGRGRAKMKKLTEGFDIGLLLLAEQVEEPAFEAALVDQLEAGSDPTSLEALLGEQPEIESADEGSEDAIAAWKRGLESNPELIQMLMEVVLTRVPDSN